MLIFLDLLVKLYLKFSRSFSSRSFKVSSTFYFGSVVRSFFKVSGKFDLLTPKWLDLQQKNSVSKNVCKGIRLKFSDLFYKICLKNVQDWLSFIKYQFHYQNRVDLCKIFWKIRQNSKKSGIIPTELPNILFLSPLPQITCYLFSHYSAFRPVLDRFILSQSLPPSPSCFPFTQRRLEQAIVAISADQLKGNVNICLRLSIYWKGFNKFSKFRKNWTIKVKAILPHKKKNRKISGRKRDKNRCRNFPIYVVTIGKLPNLNIYYVRSADFTTKNIIFSEMCFSNIYIFLLKQIHSLNQFT